MPVLSKPVQLSAQAVKDTPYLLAQRLNERGVWLATGRSASFGFIIGTVFLVLEWNKCRKSTNQKQIDKFRDEWKKYLLRYPGFFIILTGLFKLAVWLGRKVVGLRGVAADGSRIVYRRFMIALTAFLCGFTAQSLNPILSWSFALYSSTRAMVALGKLIIPPRLRPPTEFGYAVMIGVMPWFICFRPQYASISYHRFMKAVIGELQYTWKSMYGHHHGQIPHCSSLIHPEDKDCFRSLFNQYFKKLRMVFLFYFKFYMLSTVFSLPKLLTNPKQGPKIIRKAIQNSFWSTMWFVNQFYWPSRIQCWMTQHTPLRSNRAAMLTFSYLVGSQVIYFEKSESKRLDYTVFGVWRMIEQTILEYYDIDYEHHTRSHPLLGSEYFSGALFGLTCAVNCYVRSTDPSCMKSFERSVFDALLG